MKAAEFEQHVAGHAGAAAGRCLAAGRLHTQRNPEGCRSPGEACEQQRVEPLHAAVATPPSSFRFTCTQEMTGGFQSQVREWWMWFFRKGNQPTDRSSVQYLCLHTSSETRRENSSSLALLFDAVFGLWSATVGVFWTRRTTGGRDAVEAGRHPPEDGRTPETATQRAVTAATAISEHREAQTRSNGDKTGFTDDWKSFQSTAKAKRCS